MFSVTWATLVLFVGLFGGILASLEFGYRTGRNKSRMNPEQAFEGTGAMEAAIFSLLGLLLAFSFSGATSRFDARRQLIGQEANTIATAYQRLDLLPVADQPELRQPFREYLHARLQGFQKILDRSAADEEFARAARIEQQIWSQALAAGRTDPSHNVARLLLPALNQVSDVANPRAVALETYMPELIFWLLVCGADERSSGRSRNGETGAAQLAAHGAVFRDHFLDHLRDVRPQLSSVRTDSGRCC